MVIYGFFSIFLKFLFKLVPLLFFILFGEPFLNYNYFFNYAFKFEDFFLFIYIFFIFCMGGKNKKTLFSDNIPNIYSFAWFFFLLFYLINLICVIISIIVCLNKKIILTNKFTKHNRVNVPSFEIKYLNLHLSRFFKFILKYC